MSQQKPKREFAFLNKIPVVNWLNWLRIDGKPFTNHPAAKASIGLVAAATCLAYMHSRVWREVAIWDAQTTKAFYVGDKKITLHKFGGSHIIAQSDALYSSKMAKYFIGNKTFNECFKEDLARIFHKMKGIKSDDNDEFAQQAYSNNLNVTSVLHSIDMPYEKNENGTTIRKFEQFKTLYIESRGRCYRDLDVNFENNNVDEKTIEVIRKNMNYNHPFRKESHKIKATKIDGDIYIARSSDDRADIVSTNCKSMDDFAIKVVDKHDAKKTRIVLATIGAWLAFLLI